MELPHTVTGVVIKGDQRGRELGFPTANLAYGNDAEPDIKTGVYASYVHVDGVTRRSVTNIGAPKTFCRTKVVIETHILDFNQDLYEREISVQLVKRLRQVQTFSDVTALKDQILQDIAEAVGVL